MKKIYLNRMEKKTWNHININEKVLKVPYIEFKENEEIVRCINERVRKIPNPGNYTRKDQEKENNSMNNIYVIEKIEDYLKEEYKENITNLNYDSNNETIFNNGKNTEHNRKYVYGKDLIQEYGKDYFLSDDEINSIIVGEKEGYTYTKNIEKIIVDKDDEKIIELVNNGILLSNREIVIKENIVAKYVLNISEKAENTYRDNNIIIRAKQNSNTEIVIVFNENKKNFALDSIYVEVEKNAKVKLLYVFLGSGNQMIKHVTRADEKANVDIKGVYLLRKR